MLIAVFNSAENNVGKGEKDGYQHTLTAYSYSMYQDDTAKNVLSDFRSTQFEIL